MSRVSRQPTKNFVNMHDIIANPLTALPAAIDSIVRRPEPLDAVEVQSIFSELSFLILRAEEALAVRDTNAFGALMKLLAEGLTHSENAFEEGVQTFSLNSSLLRTFHTLFTILVKWDSEVEKMLFEQSDFEQVKFSVESVPFILHSNGVIEFIHVVSILCDAAALKEECGKLFMNGLLWLLLIIYNDEDEVKRHVQLQRSIATALINLVKKSRINKQRFLSWLPIATCCVKSVDTFFQLQCVELLFRVSRQRRSVFNEVASAFDTLLIDQLRDIPNDDKLLEHMENFVLSLNEKRTDVIVRFPLKKVFVADVKLTNSTNIFFTNYYFTIMVLNGNADNVTVFYNDIRSVTLTKDGKVLVRLDCFPLKLDLLLNHTAGMDVITLHMSTDNLKHFKNSSIRAWILSALELRKKAVHHIANQDATSSQVQEQKLKASYVNYSNQATTTAAAAAAAESERENLHSLDQVQKSKSTHYASVSSHVEEKTEEVKTKTLTNPYIVESKEIDRAATVSDTSYNNVSENNEDSIRSTNHSLMKITECTGLANQSTLANHQQERRTNTSERWKSNMNAANIANDVKTTYIPMEEELQTFSNALPPPLPPPPPQASTSNAKSLSLSTLLNHTPVSANNASCRVKNINTNTRGVFTQDACKLIRHIERLQDAKLEIRKKLVADKTQQYINCLEEEINSATVKSKETCASWQTVAENELSQIRWRLEETQNIALLAVAHLNENLERIKEANHALNDRCLCAEVALQRFVEESNSEEVCFIHRIRAKCAV